MTDIEDILYVLERLKMIPIKHFRLSQYRFTFTPEDIILMPKNNKGNIIRGAFGATLKKLICINQSSEDCAACSRKSTCPFQLIFKPVGLVDQKRLKDVPRGFIINPPIDSETIYTPERPFVFDMILVGKLLNCIPWIVVPFNELGRYGIGKNRGRFKLNGIDLITDDAVIPLYNPENSLFTNYQQQITGEAILQKTERFTGNRIVLEFLTPTRIRFNPSGIKGGSIVVKEPEFHHIIRRLITRVSALSSAYLDVQLDMDFRGIIERAMGVRVVDMDIRWEEAKRISRTQLDRSGRHAIHIKSGFTGKITFEGDIKEFLPLLVLGEYIHVGEDAVFGSGWYRIDCKD